METEKLQTKNEFAFGSYEFINSMRANKLL